jgi:hypothetical protein
MLCRICLREPKSITRTNASPLVSQRLLGQLKRAVETQHGGTATLAQSVPVRETFKGEAVWEGVIHVFDLQGHPKATRAYASSSPIEGSTKR